MNIASPHIVDSVASDYASRLVTRLAPLARYDGLSPTAIDGVSLVSSCSSRHREPLIYDAGLMVVVQGGKIGYLGEREIHYGAGHYLVQAMPLPFECETVVKDNEPLLGLKIKLDRLMLGELVAQLPSSELKSTPDPMAAVPIDRAVGEALLQLTECFTDTTLCRALAQSRLREVIFAVLRGPQGESLRRLVVDRGHYLRIAEALDYIEAHYTEQISIERLAQTANMSTSHFHHHFKETTRLSPLQYLKRLRLLKARALLAEGGRQVAQVSLAVGYHSNSQFSREYKQYFGCSPAQVLVAG